MDESASHKREYQILRFMPDQKRGEFANIGVVVWEAEERTPGVAFRLTRDWSFALCLDPEARISQFGDMEEYILRSIENLPPGGAFGPKSLKSMLESAPVEAAFAPLLGSISIVGKGATTHPAHVGLADGLELLMRLLVETRRLRGGL